MPSVLLATCTALPAGDEDGSDLVAALARRGVEARWVSWTDPDVRWDSSAVVLRSTWDYHATLPRFLAWVDALPRVHNAAAVVRWNVDKLYLRDLALAGVPTVPSQFFAPGEPVVLPPDGEFVVKPSLGAGSRGAGRFGPGRHDAARRHAATLHDAGRTALVQPFLGGVDTAGETALLYFAGRFSHAIRKGVMLPPGTVHPVDGDALWIEENISARRPSAAELEVGALALAVVRERFGTDPLYARVDLLPADSGPVVTELELTEPSAFLAHDPQAADRFADAIARAVAPAAA